MKHEPGMVCIVHGLHGSWTKQDNGKLVVIIKLYRESNIYGRFWQVRPYHPDDKLHGFTSFTRQPKLSVRLITRQINLIPFANEQDFAESSHAER